MDAPGDPVGWPRKGPRARKCYVTTTKLYHLDGESQLHLLKNMYKFLMTFAKMEAEVVRARHSVGGCLAEIGSNKQHAKVW